MIFGLVSSSPNFSFAVNSDRFCLTNAFLIDLSAKSELVDLCIAI